MGFYVQAPHPVRQRSPRPSEFAHTNNPAKFSNQTDFVKCQPQSASIVIVDSPNATKTACDVFSPGVRPDWGAILDLGNQRGRLVEGIAAVNDGMPKFAAEKFRRLGYSVHFSHAWDVDDCVVSQVIRKIDRANTFVLVSGDGGYCSLVKTLRRLDKRVIIVAVERCCSRKLWKLADEFHPLPVIAKSGAASCIPTGKTLVTTISLHATLDAASPSIVEGRPQ